MCISKGYKLSKITKADIQSVRYSNGNIVFQQKDSSEWYYVYDNFGNKISRDCTSNMAAGNEDILDYLLSNAEDK